MSVAELGFAVDSAPVDKGTESLKKLNQEAQLTEGQLRAIEAAAKRTGVSVAEMTAKFQAQSAAGQQASTVNQTLTQRLGAMVSSTVQAVTASKAFQAATSGVSAQLIALSAGAGPVGTFLSALGPWGIAAAVGLGAVEKMMREVSEGAHELAQKAKMLREFSESTGLTTDQVQQLRIAGVQFGLSTNDIETGVQRFTRAFAELRLGTGGMLDQIRRIRPELADQMAAVRDPAEALVLLGRAMDATKDKFEANALAIAAFGRGGARSAEFIKSFAQGISEAGGTLDRDMIEKLVKLEVEIAKMSARAKQNINSIFAIPALESEVWWMSKWLAFTESVKNFKASPDLFKLKNGDPSPLLNKLLELGKKYLDPSAAARRRLGLDATGAQSVDESGMITGMSVPLPRARPREATPEYQLETQKKIITVLGDAATAEKKLAAAHAELDLEGGKLKIGTDELTRAHNLLNESFANTKLQANISALGSAATVTEQMTAKVSALRLQLDKREIDPQYFKRAVGGLADDEAIRKQQDMVNALGDLATSTDVYKLKVMQLDQALKQEKITQETYAKAVIAAKPEFQALSEGISAAGQNITSGLTDIVMGTKSVADGFRSMALAVIRSLTEMIIKMEVTIPLMNALKQGASSIFGFGNTSSVVNGVTVYSGSGANAVSAGGAGSTVANVFEGGLSGGMVGSLGGRHYVHPAYFDDAPRFAQGGMIDWGAGERPIVAHVGERVLNKQQTDAYNRGGGSGSSIVINAQGADAAGLARVEAAVTQLNRSLETRAVRAVSDASSRGHKIIRR
jgi:hypothetical protein